MSEDLFGGEAKHYCPRAIENGGGPNSPFTPPMNGEMEWTEHNGQQVCSYCGSLHPDAFMTAMEAGTEIVPTDKSYKAYLDLPNPAAGKPTIYSSANHKPADGDRWTLATPELLDEVDISPARREYLLKSEHWVIVEPTQNKVRHKFYYQHLSDDQKIKFIELVNEQRAKFGYPGHLYVMPFFCRRKD